MTLQIEDHFTETTNSELYELFVDELSALLNAEQQLTKALPKMAEAAVSEELRSAFESHLVETEYQITRLKRVFTLLDETAQSKECKAMKCLLEEGEEMMDGMKDLSALDAALLSSAQKVEHYEIAAYGTVCAWASKMGYDKAVELLSATLEEEKAADEILTEIAENAFDAVWA